MRPLNVLIAAAAAALAPNTAAASQPLPDRYAPVDYFTTPSRGMFCEMLRGPGGGGVFCAVYRNSTDRVHRTATLLEAGRGRTRRMMGNGATTDLPVIPYGVTWAMVGGTPKIGPLDGAVNCTSRRRGLVCRNGDGHGIFLSREHVRAW